MLDNPKKTGPLLTALKAAVPFEVELLPELIKHIGAEDIAPHQMVSDVSYVGDEGGILCHIVLPNRQQQALIISLTHLRVSRSMPLASGVLDYQKHRVKKLKKQRGYG